MSEKQSNKKETPPTIITLTLITLEGGGIVPEGATATLVARRDDLAHISQFTVGTRENLLHQIEQSMQALTALEANPPPTIPEPEPVAPKRMGPSSPVKPPKPAKDKPVIADERDDQPTFSVTVAGKPKRIPLTVVNVPNASIYADPPGLLQSS